MSTLEWIAQAALLLLLALAVPFAWRLERQISALRREGAALEAGADEALMLDPHGNVATCNSTNFFIVRGGEVWTSTGAYCLHGITRGKILEVSAKAGIPSFEKDFSLFDVYSADEAFVTGTFGGLTPVNTVDGRQIGSGDRTMTDRLRALYREAVESAVAAAS
jgi:branched-chain amino acid aminotransferase